MEDKSNVLTLIKKSVNKSDPTATLILYGSYARGDYRADSDIDVIVRVDDENEKIARADQIKITYPLYDIEFQTGTIISPIVYSKKAWANHRVTPFYENVLKEGRVL